MYSWFLSLNHPKLVRPHEYIRKIRQILVRKSCLTVWFVLLGRGGIRYCVWFT